MPEFKLDVSIISQIVLQIDLLECAVVTLNQRTHEVDPFPAGRLGALSRDSPHPASACPFAL